MSARKAGGLMPLRKVTTLLLTVVLLMIHSVRSGVAGRGVMP